MQRLYKGFTLVEMIVVIAVVAILSSLAIPSYLNILKNQEAAWFHRDFLSAFQHAKSAVLIYHRPISMCGSSSLTTLCDNNWDKGIAVFIDSNNNRQHESTEQILDYFPSSIKFAHTKLKISLGLNVMKFSMDRGLPSGSYGSFSYCSDETEYIRSMIFDKIGNVRFAQDSNGDGIRDNNGTAINCS